MSGDDILLAGIGETRVGKLPGRSTVELQAEAVIAAIRDAGLSLHDVDGLLNLGPYVQPSSMFATTLAEYLGLHPTYTATVDVGGTVTGMTMIQNAIWAIEAGQCEVAVVTFGENALTGRDAGVQGLKMDNLLGGEEWEEPFGTQGMVIPYALLAQRYRDLHGAGDEDFGAIATLTRAHALMNDNAQMTRPMDMDSYRASRMIATPLRLFDCSLVSDGAGAVVLMRADRARKLGARQVAVRGIAQRTTHNSAAALPDIGDLGMADAGRRAFDAAGMGSEDIDLLALHDAFTISVLITLEALGFAAPGGAGALARSGALSLGGRVPLNTHGGLLSQAHIGGMLHIVEAVRQLSGGAGKRQVEGARTALVSGNGGVFSVCGAMILEAAA